MYDHVDYLCFWCKHENYAQTKILGNCTLMSFKIGDAVFIGENGEFYNCVLNLKNKCEKCKKETSIVIKDGEFVGVEDPQYSTIIEKHFGDYELIDEFEKTIKEKLKKIENERRKG